MARDLASWLAYLEQLHPVAIELGLERVRTVFQRLAMERVAPRVVTVTGTNGKGSTCAFLASLLAGQGLKVGVYASPHLRHYRERVQINGQPVTDAQLCSAFARVEAARGDVSLTYFEMGTLAAFWLFHAAGLDGVVLEVGLGGRLDAVNLLDADLAIVTSIGLDHAEWLGTTREQVAFEKAGIFRPGRPVVCGDPEPPEVMVRQAAALGAPLWIRGQDFGLQPDGEGWCWWGRSQEGQSVRFAGLPALSLPPENAAVALQAMLLLQPDLQAPGSALQAACLPGRLDRRWLRRPDGQLLPMLLDVGHNSHAATWLAGQLQRQPPAGRRWAVFGLLADKDLAGVLEPLLPQVDEWLAVTLPTPRARPALELARTLQACQKPVEVQSSVAAALDLLLQRAAPDDEILVLGSFYCVAEGLDWLERFPEEGGHYVAG